MTCRIIWGLWGRDGCSLLVHVPVESGHFYCFSLASTGSSSELAFLFFDLVEGNLWSANLIGWFGSRFGSCCHGVMIFLLGSGWFAIVFFLSRFDGVGIMMNLDILQVVPLVFIFDAFFLFVEFVTILVAKDTFSLTAGIVTAFQ